MVASHYRRGRGLPCVAAALGTWLIGGCVHGSLASDTGVRRPEQHWSTAPNQKAHVGEKVRFDFVLHDSSQHLLDPLGFADYCVTMFDGERIEAEPDLTGHFQFARVFDHVVPGESVEVRTTAYRQRAERDFMKIRGQWLHNDSPYDQPDREVASDAIRITFYQALVELTLVSPPDALDPETGVLRIRRSDGSTTRVYINRPHRHGFEITGPEPDGYYRVRYEPKGTELNNVGTTDADFLIYDVAGHPHRASVSLATP